MNAIGKGADGRMRMRCPECGKRLKLPPGAGGRIFRCPICASTVVSPLDPLPGMVQQPQGPREQGEAKTMARASTWTPSLVQKERYASLEKLANFLGREYVDLVQVCAHMLARTAYRDVEVAEKIQTLQGEKSARLRQFAARLAVDLDREIRELDQHPMRGSPAMAEKLETKRRERRDLALLLKIVFNLSLSEAIAAQGETPLAPR